MTHWRSALPGWPRAGCVLHVDYADCPHKATSPCKNHVDSVDRQAGRHARHQVIVHIVHNDLRAVECAVLSVDSVDTLDVRFKSLYPILPIF